MNELPAGDPDAQRRYEIRVRGLLAPHWTAWFDGLEISNAGDGTTLIAGQVADQAGLHGLLQKVRDLGLPLLTVTAVEPDPPSDAGIPNTPASSNHIPPSASTPRSTP